MCPGYLTIIFCEVPVQVFCTFFYWAVCIFFLLICIYLYLYIDYIHTYTHTQLFNRDVYYKCILSSRDVLLSGWGADHLNISRREVIRAEM